MSPRLKKRAAGTQNATRQASFFLFASICITKKALTFSLVSMELSFCEREERDPILYPAVFVQNSSITITPPSRHHAITTSSRHHDAITPSRRHHAITTPSRHHAITPSADTAPLVV